jgi:tRNA-binding EMAP/Myf-like protein
MLLNRDVVVLCNLKPRPLKGITSFGMLLCASNADKSQVEPLKPPTGTAPGTLMTFAGHISEPAEPGNRASKAYDKVADGFYVDDAGQATYMGIPMMTTLGPCTSSHLKGKIS